MRLHKKDEYWHEATVENITFKATPIGGEKLGHCYYRRDWLIESNLPFTRDQVMMFVKQEEFCTGQFQNFRKQIKKQDPLIIEDYCDSSD